MAYIVIPMAYMMAYIVLYSAGRYRDGRYGLYRDGLYRGSHGLYSHDLYSDGLQSYGLYSDGPHSYGLYGYGLYDYMQVLLAPKVYLLVRPRRFAFPATAQHEQFLLPQRRSEVRTRMRTRT